MLHIKSTIVVMTGVLLSATAIAAGSDGDIGVYSNSPGDACVATVFQGSDSDTSGMTKEALETRCIAASDGGFASSESVRRDSSAGSDRAP